MLSNFTELLFKKVPEFQRKYVGPSVPSIWYLLLGCMLLTGALGYWNKMFPQVGYTTVESKYLYFGMLISYLYASLGAYCVSRAYENLYSWLNPFPKERQCRHDDDDIKEWLSQNLFFFALLWGISSFLTLMQVTMRPNILADTFVGYISFLAVGGTLILMLSWNISFARWLWRIRID